MRSEFMTIKAVIFDLDGTITEPFFDFDAIRKEIGLDDSDGSILEAIKNSTGQKLKHIEQILDFHERMAVEQSKLNIGAKQTLQALRRRGLHVAILTRNRRDNALAVAEKHGLEFDAIIDRHDGPVKPDAFGILQICRQFSLEPGETLLVGDYLYDMLCAKAAGAVGVLIANHKNAEEFTKHADFTIDKLEQILHIIDSVR